MIALEEKTCEMQMGSKCILNGKEAVRRKFLRFSISKCDIESGPYRNETFFI